VIVHAVDIGGIVDHHCLIFLFIMYYSNTVHTYTSSTCQTVMMIYCV